MGSSKAMTTVPVQIRNSEELDFWVRVYNNVDINASDGTTHRTSVADSALRDLQARMPEEIWKTTWRY